MPRYRCPRRRFAERSNRSDLPPNQRLISRKSYTSKSNIEIRSNSAQCSPIAQSFEGSSIPARQHSISYHVSELSQFRSLEVGRKAGNTDSWRRLIGRSCSGNASTLLRSRSRLDSPRFFQDLRDGPTELRRRSSLCEFADPFPPTICITCLSTYDATVRCFSLDCKKCEPSAPGMPRLGQNFGPGKWKLLPEWPRQPLCTCLATNTDTTTPRRSTPGT